MGDRLIGLTDPQAWALPITTVRSLCRPMKQPGCPYLVVQPTPVPGMAGYVYQYECHKLLAPLQKGAKGARCSGPADFTRPELRRPLMTQRRPAAATIHDCASGKSTEIRTTDFRPDGWPLCPICGEDELMSSALDGTKLVVSLEDCKEHEFSCFKCRWNGRIVFPK